MANRASSRLSRFQLIVALAAAGDLAQVLCAGQPTTYAAAIGANKLAQVALGSADIAGPATGDQVIAGQFGRKITIAAKHGIASSAGGTGDHVALIDVDGQRLLHVTTCENITVLNPGTVAIGSWKFENLGPQ